MQSVVLERPSDHSGSNQICYTGWPNGQIHASGQSSNSMGILTKKPRQLRSRRLQDPGSSLCLQPAAFLLPQRGSFPRPTAWMPGSRQKVVFWTPVTEGGWGNPTALVNPYSRVSSVRVLRLFVQVALLAGRLCASPAPRGSCGAVSWCSQENVSWICFSLSLSSLQAARVVKGLILSLLVHHFYCWRDLIEAFY